METEKVIIMQMGDTFTIVPYPNEYLRPYKFLYFKTADREILVVGTRLTSRHSYLLQAFESERGQQPRETLVGAGRFENGMVEDWSSADFGSTPADLRPHILELLEGP